MVSCAFYFAPFILLFKLILGAFPFPDPFSLKSGGANSGETGREEFIEPSLPIHLLRGKSEGGQPWLSTSNHDSSCSMSNAKSAPQNLYPSSAPDLTPVSVKDALLGNLYGKHVPSPKIKIPGKHSVEKSFVLPLSGPYRPGKESFISSPNFASEYLGKSQEDGATGGDDKASISEPDAELGSENGEGKDEGECEGKAKDDDDDDIFKMDEEIQSHE